jgi:IclR family mhp operon transcriptional activator
LAVERYSAGFRLPLLTTAAGRVYLAHCLDEQRNAVLGILARSSKEEDALARAAPELQRLLAEIRAQGYATAARVRRTAEEISIAVPVLVEGHALAALGLRFIASELPLTAALERFLPKLRQCAADISTRFVERQPTALKHAPDAAA